MKSVKEIENIPFENLVDVSMDDGLKVPENLSERLSRNAEREVWRKRMYRVAGAAAIVILAVGLSLIRTNDEPKDTFSDPYLAYAELERALAIVSDGIQKGMDKTIEILK